MLGDMIDGDGCAAAAVTALLRAMVPASFVMMAGTCWRNKGGNQAV